jgi:carbonic anhydrase
MTPSQAWDSLLEGNKRYASDTALNCNRNYDRRHEVAEDPRPFATILGCADSRVPPEIIFDQGLGDLFTVRLAGNVADAYAIGSLEFAVLNFGSALIVVLGHEKCGAVIATIDAVEKKTSAPGYIDSIMSYIKPAVAPLVGKPGYTLDAAIRANIRAVARSLSSKSSILAQHISSGKLQIKGACYSLTDGQVTPVDIS